MILILNLLGNCEPNNGVFVVDFPGYAQFVLILLELAKHRASDVDFEGESRTGL